MTGEDEPVGSVGEEATKLFLALQDWARENKGEYAAQAGVFAAAAAEVNEHIATGGKDCRYCPLCLLISSMRSTSPEVRHHLSSAGSSLLEAVNELMASGRSSREHRAGSPFEKIDLDDD